MIDRIEDLAEGALGLDDALLMSPLRRLQDEWRQDAVETDSAAAREVYLRVVQDLQRVIRGQDARRQAWAVMKQEMLDVFREGMREYERAKQQGWTWPAW